jgi:sulfur carrier protein ThiS
LAEVYNALALTACALPSCEKQVVSTNDQKGCVMSTKDTAQYVPATVSVFLQPDDKELTVPRPKNAQQLLQTLGLRSCTALVAREGELLTPDRAIYAGDRLLVRKVTSSG